MILAGSGLLLLALLTRAWVFRRRPAASHPSSILITGAGAGIGRDAARAFAALPGVTHLVLWDVNARALEALKRDLASAHPALAVLCERVDVSSDGAVAEGAARAAAFCGGGVDCVVSNAGVVDGKDADAATHADVARAFGVNTFASFHIVRHFFPGWKRRVREAGMSRGPGAAADKYGGGCLILVSSVMGMVGSAKLATYCASKAALSALGDCLRLELCREGLQRHIRVVTLCPYAVR